MDWAKNWNIYNKMHSIRCQNGSYKIFVLGSECFALVITVK